MRPDYTQENNSKTKKPTLILHIGTCKTGTSALQACLAKNQKFLADNKICYSEFYTPLNFHLNLTLSLMREYFEKNNINDATLTYISPTSDIFSHTPTEIIEKMKDNFYKNNCNTMIISDECLFESTIWWSYPRSLNTEYLMNGRKNYVMKYFREAFKEFDIKIVCYLRRQDNYVESLYNQWLKSMSAELYDTMFNVLPSNDIKYKINEDSAPNKHMAKLINGLLKLDYYEILADWAELFGKENIMVRIYEKSCLPKGIEHDFFINVLNFDNSLLANLKLYEEVNASFKKDIIEYKMAAGLFNLPGAIYDLNESPSLDYLSKNKSNILTSKQADELLEYYNSSNEKIAREYLNKEDGILFYDKKREEKDDYPGLSVQAAIDISRELILMLENK